MELALEEFGFELSDPRNFDSNYEYAVYHLKRGGDAALRDIDAYLLPADPGEASIVHDAGPWAAGSIRLFISHTSANKVRAAKLAEILARYGIAGFVAHDTIEPTREWQTEIEKALATCDALCALVTPDFVESRWCDQEVGFVMARRKLIVPLKLGADPHGFIGKYQAITIGERDAAWDVGEKLLLALVRSAQTADAIAPAIVRRYARSGSFEATRGAFEMLKEIPERAWTQDLIDQTARAAVENNQVEHANLADGTGRSIPAVVAELLEPLRQPAAAPVSDDDIPF